jgi:hypothetical protein
MQSIAIREGEFSHCIVEGSPEVRLSRQEQNTHTGLAQGRTWMATITGTSMIVTRDPRDETDVDHMPSDGRSTAVCSRPPTNSTDTL